jgi:hypothetical protein
MKLANEVNDLKRVLDIGQKRYQQLKDLGAGHSADLGKIYKDDFIRVLKNENGGKYLGYIWDERDNQLIVVGDQRAVQVILKKGQILSRRRLAFHKGK